MATSPTKTPKISMSMPRVPSSVGITPTPPKSKFKMAHESFRMRMFQEQHGYNFEPVESKNLVSIALVFVASFFIKKILNYNNPFSCIRYKETNRRQVERIQRWRSQQIYGPLVYNQKWKRSVRR